MSQYTTVHLSILLTYCSSVYRYLVHRGPKEVDERKTLLLALQLLQCHLGRLTQANHLLLVLGLCVWCVLCVGGGWGGGGGEESQEVHLA